MTVTRRFAAPFTFWLQRPRFLLVFIVFSPEAFVGFATAAPAEDSLRILANQCVRCHAGTDSKSGLNLSTLEGILQGGDHGPAIQIGSPDMSLLIQRITEGSMPPIGDGDPLPVAEIDLLRHWIQAGAAWPSGKQLVIPPELGGAPPTITTPQTSTEEKSSCPTTSQRHWVPCGGSLRGGSPRRPRLRSSWLRSN